MYVMKLTVRNMAPVVVTLIRRRNRVMMNLDENPTWVDWARVGLGLIVAAVGVFLFDCHVDLWMEEHSTPPEY